MNCNRCGNQLSESSQFCNRCGARTETSGEVSQSYQSPPPPPRPARRHPVMEKPPAPRRVVVPNRYEEPEPQYEVEEEIAPPSKTSRRIDPNVLTKNGEAVIFEINPALYPVTISYIVSFIITLIFSGLIGYLGYFGLSYALWGIGIFAAVVFTPSLIKHIKFRSIVFTLTDTKLEIETGIIAKTSRNIPLRHIQDVFVSETFGEKLIGIGDILIDTAAEVGKIRLDNISNPRHYADLILEQLHDRD